MPKALQKRLTPFCKLNGICPTNLLDFGFRKNEKRTHEAQKPLDLIEYLIKPIIKLKIYHYFMNLCLKKMLKTHLANQKTTLLI